MHLFEYNEKRRATRQRPRLDHLLLEELMMIDVTTLTDGERARFWAKVDKDQVGTGCWEWTAYLAHGYGMFTSGTRLRGYKGHLAHRLVYQMLVGPIPEGLELDHLCRNTSCCNWQHVEPVTHAENIRRCGAMAKATAASALASRLRTHCRQGHALETIRRSSPCMVCARARKARQEAKWTDEQREAKREYVRQWRDRQHASP